MSDDGRGFRPTLPFSGLAPQLREISKAACQIQLREAISGAVQAAGCEYYVFAPSVPAEEGASFVPMMSTLPASVMDAMASKGFYRSNPVLSRLRQTGNAVVVALNRDDPNPVIGEVSRLMSPYGIVGAVLVPVLSATSDLSVIGGYSRKGVPTHEVISSLRIIGAAASIRLLELHDLPQLPVLTGTQTSILQWAAAGKSNGDIAEIVGLSRRNCDYHMGEIFRKLGVATRGQAIAALAEGKVQSPMSAASREK